MLTPFDQFAKQVVAAVLDLCGRVATEHQVVVPVQAADIYYQPDRLVRQTPSAPDFSAAWPAQSHA